MDRLTLSLIIMVTVFSIIIILLSAALCIRSYKIDKLTKSIDEFIKTGKLTEISTSDDNISHLNAGICELQNRLIFESFTHPFFIHTEHCRTFYINAFFWKYRN